MDQNTQPTQPQPQQYRGSRSEQLNELTAALAKAQGAILPALKDANNPHFGSAYATLAAVWEACRKPLSDHGLAVVQTTYPSGDGKLMLVTTLLHTSGQWISGVTPVLTDKWTAQGMGSGLTYARRYALAAMVGVAPDDDDDATAAGNANKRPEQRAKAQGDTRARPAPAGRSQGQPGKPSTASSPPPADGSASEAQIKKLFAMAKDAGYVLDDGKVDVGALKHVIFEIHGDAVVADDGSDVTTKKLTWAMMDPIYKRLQGEIDQRKKG